MDKLETNINPLGFHESRESIVALASNFVRNRLNELFESYTEQIAFLSTGDDGIIRLACSDFANELGNPDGPMCYHDLEKLLADYLTADGENLRGFIDLLRKHADLAEEMLNDTQ